MCTFTFCYRDGTEISFENITNVRYFNGEKNIEVSENELLTHCFPTKCTLHLFTNGFNRSVSGKFLSYIEVQKEDE